MARVTIFHTSDMHNKLTPELAECLKKIKSSAKDSLLLDSGDAIWAGNAFWRPGGEPILDFMNSVPYDALCVGNREFHFLHAGMRSKIFRAQFSILSANLRAAKPSGKLFARPHAVFERGGMKIGVLGLSVPCVTEGMMVKKVSDFYFVSPEEAAAEVVPELRASCDLVLALTHIGIKSDRELAERVSGIDLILGGHTHTVTQEPEIIGDTTILHHGCYVHFVGRVDVEFGSGRVEVRNELIPLAKA